ncbi:DNA alkylation repair protein [Thermoleophilia bacterium SCSIO 60948]|nr:DNA alkylation repair protein [Thermoleophilia bacterium SCSIO 60948]
MVDAAGVRAALRELAEPEHAAARQRFFKTGPGEYGEGDVFLGLRVPDQRRVARTFAELPLADCAELLGSETHEDRFTALAILRLRFERGDAAARERIADLYLDHLGAVDNWDLVDASAPYLLADRVRSDPMLLDSLVVSERLWDRRVAILATFPLIREGVFDRTLELSEKLLGDEHDLIHKAVGWMLREVGNRDPDRLRGFLAEHAGRMPRTALRYAIERLDPAERKRWMSVPRVTG